MPLSPTVALMADWQGTPASTALFFAKPAMTREVNRRIISASERFIRSPWQRTGR